MISHLRALEVPYYVVQDARGICSVVLFFYLILLSWGRFVNQSQLVHRAVPMIIYRAHGCCRYQKAWSHTVGGEATCALFIISLLLYYVATNIGHGSSPELSV